MILKIFEKLSLIVGFIVLIKAAVKIPAVKSEYYNEVKPDKEKESIYTYADGYMKAWFRYTLMGDEKAAEVFIGEYPEILHNQENWSDVSSVKGRLRAIQ